MNLTLEQAKTLLASLAVDQWSKTLELGDGYTARAKLMYDMDTRLEESGDWFGTLAESPRHSRERPAGFDGAARKIDTRNGPLWWQPPVDVLTDPASLATLETRVRDYYLEYWTYVGVVLEVTGPPCPCCGERKTHDASLWGIESDAGDYFAEVLTELAHDLNERG